MLDKAHALFKYRNTGLIRVNLLNKYKTGL